MSDCPTTGGVVTPDDRILHFRTIPGKYAFEDVVETLQLFVYDDDDDALMAVTREVPADELAANGYTLSLAAWEEIEHYNYHVIGVVNPSDDYELLNTYSLRDFQTSIKPFSGDTVNHEVSDMFVGYLNLAERTRAAERDTIYMEKLLNRIYITIEFRGFELKQGSELYTKICGNNAQYDYLNNCLTTGYMNYLPYNMDFVGDRSYFKFDIITGKLYIGDDLELHIELYDEEDNLEEKTSFMLVDYISRIQDSAGNYLYNTNKKLQEEDEFFIHIVVNEDFEIIAITINNWYWVNPGVDL